MYLKNTMMNGNKVNFILFVIVDMVLTKDLTVYWNIPTFMCHQYGLNFTEAATKFNFVQNKDDQFRGEKFSILYEPGMFPSLSRLANGSIHFRNGGVPQEGSLYEHIGAFTKDVDLLVPDVHNNGIIVIDFEMWRPILRQNFGNLVPCKTVSYDIERSLNPSLSRSQAELEASRRFETAGRQFMDATLKLAKQLRPAARWGYYAFPYCFNGNEDEDCSQATRAENDRLDWLFEAADVVLPSVYMSERHLKAHNRPKMVRGRVREAVRVAEQQKHKPPVLVYMRYVFTDTRRFLSKDDWQTVFDTSQQTGASGVILWGSSSDLNTRQKCVDFADYLETTLGPVIIQYASVQANDTQRPPSSDHLPIYVILILSLTVCSMMLTYLGWALWSNSRRSSMQFLPQDEAGS